MIMPDVFSSVRQIDRENNATPISSFFKKTFTIKKYRHERMKRSRLLTKKQKDSIRKLPRDSQFKGVGKELLDKLSSKYKGKVDFIYLDALDNKKTFGFYNTNGFNPIYSSAKNTVYKSFHDTVSMVKLLKPDECGKKSKSSPKKTRPRKSIKALSI